MDQGYYKSIRKNILLSMILVPVIPFILSLAIGYYYFVNALETNTIASMKRIAADHRRMIESFLEERSNDLMFILRDYRYDQLSRADILEAVFLNLQSGSPAFVDLGVFDQNGSHVAYQGPYALKWKVYRDENWFKQVLAEGSYVSDIFLGYRQVPHFIIALTKIEGGRKWVLRATIDTQMFSELVEKVRIGKTGEAYLLDADGVLQTRQRAGRGLMEKPLDKIKYPDSSDEILTYIGADVTQEDFLYAAAWLKNKEWLLVIRQEKADAFDALRSAVQGIIWISLLGGGMIIGVAFYMTGRIVARMKQMDSEKENLGHQLIRAQRLAELGEMAAGFAHEINNPLQIIRSEQTLIEMNIDEMKEKGELKPSEGLAEVDDSMAQIKLQIERCSGITQAILKFGRQGEPRLQEVDLREFIPQVTGMVAKKAGVNGIEVIEEISDATPPVHGDPGQLQQVLLNLFNNAMDAISTRRGASGGRIRIKTGPKGDKQIEIVVSDNGCGITGDNLKKVFSPFFTTKPVGKGTGLGLSVCYGIVDKMGGEMTVDSKAGEGTTFTMRFPSAA